MTSGFSNNCKHTTYFITGGLLEQLINIFLRWLGIRTLLDTFVHMFQTVHSIFLQTCLASFCTNAFSIMKLTYISYTYITSVL